jgi:putative hydrolase of the HAD superfamily
MIVGRMAGIWDQLPRDLEARVKVRGVPVGGDRPIRNWLNSREYSIKSPECQGAYMQKVESDSIPRVIFLDAVGTLFGVKGSVGEVYSQIAQQHGVTVDAAALNRAFLTSFRAAGVPAFPHVDNAAELQAQEFVWWMAIARQTFQQVGSLQTFSDFSEFFADLYQHFATAAPWVVYADVRPCLQKWRQMGIPLAVLSNFDSRLHAVLQALDLAQFFASVTISTEAGFAKPDPQIFAIALQKHRCQPDQAWHIGDSYEEDSQAARSAGLRGIWLKRPG